MSAAEKRGHLLLGFPRSGTTLLARLLDAHPEVSCPPETYLFRSAARFLQEQDQVEGPPIGVLSGLNFSGFTDEEVMAPLRQVLFDAHARIAGDKPLWVEKTAVDIFHLETLEPFVGDYLRFVLIERNPLDVIVSNMGLAKVMGAQLHELFEATRGINDPYEGLARSWAERSVALNAFAVRHPERVHRVRYEALTRAPEGTLAALFKFLNVSGDPAEVLQAAFGARRKMGLGDFNFDTTTMIHPGPEMAWRGKIPPAALARIIPILEEQMQAAGYAVPKLPRALSRADRVRQFQLAVALKQDASRQESDS